MTTRVHIVLSGDPVGSRLNFRTKKIYRTNANSLPGTTLREILTKNYKRIRKNYKANSKNCVPPIICKNYSYIDK